ncbi:MAG: DUF4340 domain-containing protein [Burkholderiaceae bacterium]
MSGSGRRRWPLASLFWFLLALAGVAASVVQLHDGHVERHADHHHDHGSEHAPKRLFDWPPEAAARLTVTAPGRTRVFVRDPAGEATGHWRTAGSEEVVGVDLATYLVQFSQARSDREIDPGNEGDARFGLAEPLLGVEVRAADGAVLARLSVGQRTPDGFGRYVRDARTPDRVVVIPHYQFGPAWQLLGLPEPS